MSVFHHFGILGINDMYSFRVGTSSKTHLNVFVISLSITATWLDRWNTFNASCYQSNQGDPRAATPSLPPPGRVRHTENRSKFLYKKLTKCVTPECLNCYLICHKALAAGALPQIPLELEELTALPQALCLAQRGAASNAAKGAASKTARVGKGREGKEPRVMDLPHPASTSGSASVANSSSFRGQSWVSAGRNLF